MAEPKILLIRYCPPPPDHGHDYHDHGHDYHDHDHDYHGDEDDAGNENYQDIDDDYAYVMIMLVIMCQ